MGLVLGAILGSIASLRVIIWGAAGAYGGSAGAHFVMVGMTVAVSLVGCVLWGTLMGAMLPFVLRRLGADPASASAPLVATLVDVSGIIIYFTIASAILTGTVIRSAPDACTVARPAELQEIFGAKFERGAAESTDMVSGCEWTHDKTAINIHTGLTDADAFDDFIEILPGKKESLTGLGDKAYFQPDFGAVFALAGDTRVTISYTGPPRKTLPAEEQALLKRILARL
jgi:hypothetical protein